MIELAATVTGADEVRRRFEQAGPAARDRVRETVQRLGLELLRKVKEEKLTGQVLRVQTGRLRRSVNEQTTMDGDVAVSTVGTNVSYGRFWELGFRGSETVHSYSRLGHIVRSHLRVVNQAARPFLQPALAEMRSRILDQLSVALKGAV